MIRKAVKTEGMTSHMLAHTGHRRLFLESAWLGYIVFTLVAFPCCNISVMLPSILLCGLSTWLYNYKVGLLTVALTLLYNMLAMMHNLESLQGWSIALEPGGIFAQLLAVLCIAVIKMNHCRTQTLTALIEERVQERYKELQEITEYITKHSDAEKANLSKKLYDVVNDQLTGLLHHSETLMNFLSYTDAPQTANAVKLVEIAEENIKQIENLSWKLSARTISKSGIEQAVHDMCEHLEKTAGTHFSISITQGPRNTSNPFTQLVYRIIHEIVTNALRHGKASKIRIKLKMNGNALSLRVVNNGLPLPDSLIEGVGLHLIRERAEKIHAAIEYTHNLSGQTIFTCTSKFASIESE